MIGLVAAIAATIGDLCLLATSNAARPGFEWLPAASAGILLAGTVLGVLAIPCYGFGYRGVAARFEPRLRRWIAALGIAGGVLGGATHGITGVAIHRELASRGGVDPIALVGRWGDYLLPLWAGIAVVSAVGSFLYAFGVLGGRTTLPRWAALANPLAVTVVLALAGAGSETGRAILVPAAPNVAHVVFFGTLAAIGRRGSA